MQSPFIRSPFVLGLLVAATTLATVITPSAANTRAARGRERILKMAEMKSGTAMWVSRGVGSGAEHGFRS